MLGCQSLVTLVRLTACRVKNNLSQYEESSFVCLFFCLILEGLLIMSHRLVLLE